GSNTMIRSCNTLRLLHFRSVNSLTQIIKADTEVLNEKRSISSSTFLMILCKALYSALLGSSSETWKLPSASWNKRHSLRRNLYTPSIPLVFQGFACSNGPKNISYKRKVSAPYFSTTSSGLTTLNLDLDIFSTSVPQMYLPFSRINSASAKSGRKFLNFSRSRISL